MEGARRRYSLALLWTWTAASPGATVRGTLYVVCTSQSMLVPTPYVQPCQLRGPGLVHSEAACSAGQFAPRDGARDGD